MDAPSFSRISRALSPRVALRTLQPIRVSLFIKAYAAAIVMDWKGFTKDLITHDDADAEIVLDLNKDNIEAVLRAQPELFTDIQKSSDTLSLYRAEINEADSKN